MVVSTSLGSLLSASLISPSKLVISSLCPLSCAHNMINMTSRRKEILNPLIYDHRLQGIAGALVIVIVIYINTIDHQGWGEGGRHNIDLIGEQEWLSVYG